MNRLNKALFALALLGGQYLSFGASLPSFRDYPAGPVFHGRPARPRFQASAKNLWDSDERFRDNVRFGAERGPNFAGHYTLAELTCGSGCKSIVVLDARTGTIYRDMPYFSLLIGPQDDGTGGMFLYAGNRYRLNSTLLIAEGCFDATNGPNEGYCARMYYKSTRRKFTLIHKSPVKQPG